MPTEEESLIRHCTLGRAEMDLIQAKRTPHNRLGLAIQLCFLRHLGRAIRRTPGFCYVLQCRTATHSSCRDPASRSRSIAPAVA